MNKSRTIHEFDTVIYPRLLWVVYDCPLEILKDMFGNEAQEMEDNSDAEVIRCCRQKPDKRGGVLIRFRKKSDMTIGTIAHEATHAAMEIFEYIGARIDYENQEPFAYLVGWITECCNKVRHLYTK